MQIGREVLVTGLAAAGVAGYLLLRNAQRPPVAPAPQARSPASDQRMGSNRLTMRHRTGPLAEADPPAQPTNRLARFLGAQSVPEVRPERLMDYLQANHRNAESLLGAYRVTRDPALLHEALEKFPTDPRVHFDAVCFGPPEERRKWLEAFKQAAQDNSLPNYLSAHDYFKAGQPAQAVQELAQAAAKPVYQDYSFDFMQNAEEAYRAAGYSDAEAKAAATTQLLLPQLAQFKQTAVGLIELAKSYRQSGDEDSARATLQMVIDLGQRLDAPGTLTVIQSLVGTAIERMALNQMDPNAPLGETSRTVQERIDATKAQRQALRESVARLEALLPALPEREVSTYFERMRYFGERKAMDWLLDKYGRH